MRARLVRAFDRFVDVREMSPPKAAERMQVDGVDIVIDLTGYTAHGRTGILAFRPAPIQVNFLGYPGTLGADFVDYIVADRVVIPEDQHSFYAEKAVYLPDTYQPNDTKRHISERVPTRAETGLSDTGFVFCS